jgi:hypothetical protein
MYIKEIKKYKEYLNNKDILKYNYYIEYKENREVNYIKECFKCGR